MAPTPPPPRWGVTTRWLRRRWWWVGWVVVEGCKSAFGMGRGPVRWGRLGAVGGMGWVGKGGGVNR